jgi:hypothetical protein
MANCSVLHRCGLCDSIHRCERLGYMQQILCRKGRSIIIETMCIVVCGEQERQGGIVTWTLSYLNCDFNLVIPFHDLWLIVLFYTGAAYVILFTDDHHRDDVYCGLRGAGETRGDSYLDQSEHCPLVGAIGRMWRKTFIPLPLLM